MDPPGGKKLNGNRLYLCRREPSNGLEFGQQQEAMAGSRNSTGRRDIESYRAELLASECLQHACSTLAQDLQGLLQGSCRALA